MPPKYFVTILVLVALALPASPAHAGGIVSVCDEAHLLAALVGGGTVTFSCSGTIILTAEITIAADTTIDGSGQTVTISGNHALRVFTVNLGVTLSLNELTVADGNASGSAGGGISNSGTVTVSNSTFSGNSADYGGAISGGILTVNNSTFSGNSASSGGGGIANWDRLTVSNSTFSDNRAENYGGGGAIRNSGNSATVIVSSSTFTGNSAYNGGGIRNYEGAVTVSNSTFSSNTTTGADGGGIYNYDGAVTVSSSTFSDNSATDGGGGIYNSGDGRLTVSNSTFSDNSATGGGGISNSYSVMLTVSNSTFSGNSASSSGGGISNNTSTVTVSNSTFSGNSAGQAGGGISSFGGLTVSNSTFSGNSASNGGGIRNSGYTVTLENTIVANSPTGNNCSGVITDGGGNLSYSDTTCPGINANPILDPLQNNGGPTQTMGLGSGSAALDAANDAMCAAPPVNNLDQRGVPRPQGPHCDIGAVEQFCPNFVPPTTVGVEDIVAIVAFWGWTSSTPGWVPAYDLNLDNKVDIVDIMLVTAGWGRTCS